MWGCWNSHVGFLLSTALGWITARGDGPRFLCCYPSPNEQTAEPSASPATPREEKEQFCKSLDVNRLKQGCGAEPFPLSRLWSWDYTQFRAGKRHMNVDAGPGSSKIVFTFICKAITDDFFFLCLITWEVEQTCRKSYILFHSGRLVKQAALVYRATGVKWNWNFLFMALLAAP